ncbi:hypothetical protein KUTeg_022199 [Tegillarca granosa]|uniref:HAT C-terminal dimerisation domain-containing protein n=1 Tax=Tegillarca granosa TaxID=220873 RepID=A0ABQ9E6C3_TEGGR|nr:hypothetical protein KUTeg_022199 [Tegillarca granosa]
MPRLAQRQRNCANPPAYSPSEYWKRALYYPFLDHIIPIELNVNFNTFASEVGCWKTRWSLMDADARPQKLIDTINCPGLYPSITKVLIIMLTMPATTATAESFSVIKRVKS